MALSMAARTCCWCWRWWVRVEGVKTREEESEGDNKSETETSGGELGGGGRGRGGEVRSISIVPTENRQPSLAMHPPLQPFSYSSSHTQTHTTTHNHTHTKALCDTGEWMAGWWAVMGGGQRPGGQIRAWLI